MHVLNMYGVLKAPETPLVFKFLAVFVAVHLLSKWLSLQQKSRNQFFH